MPLVCALNAEHCKPVRGGNVWFYICIQSAVLMIFLSSKIDNHQSKVIVVLRFL